MKNKTIKASNKESNKAANKTIRKLARIHYSLYKFNKSRVPTLRQFNDLEIQHRNLMNIVEMTEDKKEILKKYSPEKLSVISSLLEMIEKSIHELPNYEEDKHSKKITESNV